MKTFEYRGLKLTVIVAPGDAGYCVSVAVVGANSAGVRAQRFLDVGVFSTASEGRSAALAHAQAWVDEEARAARRGPDTDFAPSLA